MYVAVIDKIRITLAEWHGLLRLISEIHQQKHLDAEYVFTRLRHDHAFYFVATKTEVIIFPFISVH